MGVAVLNLHGTPKTLRAAGIGIGKFLRYVSEENKGVLVNFFEESEGLRLV